MDKFSTTPTALITGASAGIGTSFANLLAAEGYNLILVARREDRLRELAAKLTSQHPNRYEVLTADLADPSAPSQLYAAVEELGMSVDLLVNNAGFSGKDPFTETSWQSLASELQVMVVALTELSHLFVPGMKQKGQGYIINVASTAALLPPASGFLYTGIKSYVVKMSEALDLELKPHGVHVSALCPGFTKTEFHDVMKTREAVNSGLPDFAWQLSDDVARESYKAVLAGKPICVSGWINKILVAALGRLPESWRYNLGKKNTLFASN